MELVVEEIKCADSEHAISAWEGTRGCSSSLRFSLVKGYLLFEILGRI